MSSFRSSLDLMLDRTYNVTVRKSYCSSVNTWPDVMLLLAQDQLRDWQGSIGEGGVDGTGYTDQRAAIKA